MAACRHAIPRHVGIGGTLVTVPHPVDDGHSKSDVLAADFPDVVAEEFGLPPVVVREPILNEGCVVDLAFFPSRVCPRVFTENAVHDAGTPDDNMIVITVAVPLTIPKLRVDEEGPVPCDVHEGTVVEVHFQRHVFGPGETHVPKGDPLEFHIVEVYISHVNVREHHIPDDSIVHVPPLEILASHFHPTGTDFIVEVVMIFRSHNCRTEQY